jgi:cell division protease FtsH
MKFATTAVMALLLAEQTSAFSTFTPIKTNYKSSSSSSSSSLSMAIDMPPAEATTVVNTVAESSTPIITKSTYGPTDVRYSDFLKLVDGNKIEKVTFSADGTQLLGVDVDGTRLKIESLPNDPELLSQLTGHKVRVFCVFFA